MTDAELEKWVSDVTKVLKGIQDWEKVANDIFDAHNKQLAFLSQPKPKRSWWRRKHNG